MRLVRPDDTPDRDLPARPRPVLTLQVRDAHGVVIAEISLDVSSPPVTVGGVQPARAAKPAGEQGCSPSPLKIDPSGPSMVAMLEEYEQARRASDITTGHLRDCMAAVKEATGMMGWVWPGQVTPAEITDYLAHKKAGGASPKYRNHLRAILLHFAEFLKHRGAHPGLDPKAIPRAKRVRRRTRYCPSKDEVARLIVASAADWRKRDRWLVYLIAASTGLRMRTLSLLKPEHVKRGVGLAWLDLPGSIVKNGEATHVWLTRECAERIEAHVAAGKCRHGYLLGAVPKWEHFERDLKLAGLAKRPASDGPTFSRHSLRHFAATWLRSADRFSDDERKAQMGHRTLAMTTQVYTDEASMAIGEKIWRMEPLLPPGFSGVRGRRVTKNGGPGLAKSRDLGQYHNAKPRDEREHAPDSISTPPAPPQVWSGFGDQGSRDYAGGLDVESLHGTPKLDSPRCRSGVPVRIRPPRFDDNEPPIESGSSSRMIAALQAVIDAQANLISVLLKERPNVRPDRPPDHQHESEDRPAGSGPPPQGGR